VFIEKANGTSLLKFGRKRQLKEYLTKIIDSPVFIKDAEADESWQYDEYDLNCFSLCLQEKAPTWVPSPDFPMDGGDNDAE